MVSREFTLYRLRILNNNGACVRVYDVDIGVCISSAGLFLRYKYTADGSNHCLGFITITTLLTFFLLVITRALSA